ncbi:MFS transporter [Rhizobium leguminosarum]|jgi:MFS family permease|uniref:MFS transporter n=1 Tax=Rhizobium leguminosarum TaxID=384 RepID=UPI0010324010|nr:MFS transporter [Rhizobium leguminosarum]TAU73784.1 MFS transporter [Rhizobium leguminosarum]TAX03342.1 MFS transporter [Rhizobium leguminosarum]TAX24023.1 MFS transporter [Rhizobium leguminosarum]TAY05710.1 MFS transporter [Rhizobium leguminosarum]TAZ03545.1 MFS transporter [Rhizobium leguminosarum]
MTEPTTVTSGKWRPFAVLALLFLFQTLNFFDKLVFGLSAVPMMKELGISPQQFGLIGSSFFLLFSISGVLVGLFVIGRMPVKWILVILAAIWSIAQIPIYFTSSVTVLIACRILLGLGEGPGLPTALHACHNWFSPEKRSVPSAVVLQGISVGLLAGGPILTYIIVSHGWRSGFLFCGLIGIVWIVAWLLIGGEGPHATTENEKVRATVGDPPVPARKLWLDPTVIGVIIMSTMSYWIVGMSATWLPPFLQQGLGYSQTETGSVISAVYIFQSPLLLVGSWIAQRMLQNGVSKRTTLGSASGYALLVSGVALIASVHVSGPLQLALIAIAFAAPSLTTIYGPITLGSVAPAAQRGRLIVVIYSANAISALASNAVTGMIVQAAGPDHVAAGYANAMLFTAGVLIIGAISAFALIFPDRTIERFGRMTRFTEQMQRV